MKTNDYIAKYVFNIPGEKIDQLAEQFDFNFDNEDVENAISYADISAPETIGNCVWLMVMDKLQNRLAILYPEFDKDKFDWDNPNDGADNMDIYYDGETFENLWDLESLLDKQDD